MLFITWWPAVLWQLKQALVTSGPVLNGPFRASSLLWSVVDFVVVLALTAADGLTGISAACASKELATLRRVGHDPFKAAANAARQIEEALV